MDKNFLKKYVVPTLAVGWFIGMFFMGWKTILWTCIGIAIGTIVKQLKENV